MDNMTDTHSEMKSEARKGPLSGITVIDITRVVAGPYAAMILADLGATVIKVENPADPDYTRSFPPFVENDDIKESAFFAQYNRNKQGVTINLQTEQGKALLRKLLDKADVLIENFRPGTMKKLGLDYEVLRQEFPSLIYAAISGFGQYGPSSSKPAYDNSGQATGGLWSMNGYEDRPPVRVGTIIGDLVASLYAVIGILAAKRQVDQTGIGQQVDISQQDSVLSMTENAVVRYTVNNEIAKPLGNDHPFVSPYGQYPCKDGYVFFGGYTDKFWAITCKLFNEPELANDSRIDTMEKRFDPKINREIISPLLERWFGQYTKAELEELAGDTVPLSSIKNIAEVVEDPHILARQMIVNVPVADQLVRMMGSPINLSGLLDIVHQAAPKVGEHNDLIFKDLLGLNEQDLQDLITAKVI